MIKGLFRLIGFLILLVILCFIFAPNLLSTNVGKAAFFKLYRTITGNILKADDLKLSWWKGQKLQNISWSNPSKKIALQVDSAQTTASLWQIIFYHDLGDLHLIAPKTVISTDFTPPLPQPPARSQAGFIPTIAAGSLKSSFVTPYYGQIVLDKGEVQFVGKEFSPIDLKDIHLEASLLKSQIKLSSRGTTSQDTIGGNFDLSLLYVPEQSQIDLAAELHNFPIRSLDQMIFFSQPALRGSLLTSIGEAIDIKLTLCNLPQTLAFYCNASSPSFNAKIETKTEGGLVTLTAPATIQFQVPPAIFQKLTSLTLEGPFHADVKIDNFSMPLEDKESFAFQATLHGEASHLLGNEIPAFSLLLSTQNFKSRNFTLKIDSSELQLNSSLHLPDPWHQLTLNGEALLQGTTHINFSAETLSAITAQIQGDLFKATATGSYDPTSQQVTTKFNADPFHLQGISINAATLSLIGNLQTRQGTFQFSSAVDQGTLQASGTFVGAEKIDAHATLSHIPTTLANLFFKNPPPLEALVGPFLDATADLSSHQQKNQVALKISSQNLTLEAFLLDLNSTLTTTKPTRLTWTLTPEGYTALDHWMNTTPTPLTLSKPAVINMTLPTLLIPYHQLSQTTYQSQLAIDTLAFSGTQLNQIKISAEHTSPQGPLVFQLIAQAANGSATVNGNFDLASGSTQLKTQIDQFPTEALDIVAHALGQTTLSFSALLGPQMNLTASASLTDWNGPLELELNTPQMRSSLKGTVTAGVLTLNDTFHLQMSLTKEASQAIFKSSFSSNAPLTLEIPPQGFSYPLNPFNPANMTIPSGRLELGKITCHNEGNLNTTLGLLKQSQYSKNQDLELWFAPLDFHLNQGIMDCERTEILLANSYQICTWGNVNFISRWVDMTLGLTASCLKKAFGIEDLPSSYVLQIPMEGPLDDVKIDTSKATSKVTTLLLWQQKSLAGSLAGGKAGALLGKFVNKALPLPDGSAKAPAPKHPFPWESSPPQKSKKTSSAEPKKKKLTLDEAPLKQALKLLR